MNIYPCCEETLNKLKELVQASDGVVVTGHKNSDFDTVGACYAIYTLAGFFGRPAFISIDLSGTLSGALVQRINERDGERITDPADTPPKVTENTLLVLVDTNRESLMDYPELLKLCKNTVVIDHHQSSGDMDDREGMFIHEQDYSSTCEIAAKLLSFAGCVPGPTLAEALWAGIMLDTRNLTRRVCARTFYTIGSLCELGADQSVIADFFDCDPAHYRDRAAIVCAAKVKNGCAVSTTRLCDERVRIIGPQAANELLTIEGVKASFVIYKYGNTVYVSARSDGRPDISAVMEKLGGGGSRAMAAAQFPGARISQIERKLYRAIRELNICGGLQ